MMGQSGGGLAEQKTNTGQQRSGPRILVVRNDKIGDFMLAWPALALLRRSLPDAHISVLVPGYTRALAQRCPWIDQVLLDPEDIGRLDARHFDAMLTLFSTSRIAWAGWRGRIPIRVAPATKWFQVLHNRRLTQRRSRSLKPEYEYNLDLAAHLLRELGQAPADNLAPYWPVPQAQRESLRRELAGKLRLPLDRPWIFLHAGSGGSAVNLDARQYTALIRELHARWPFQDAPAWVLTAGPGEHEQALLIQRELDGVAGIVRCHGGEGGLGDFALSLSAADLFMAGSTGPLHIAAALDVPTVGFFPARRSATSLRWRPCNGPGRTLAFSHAGGMDDKSPERLDIDVADAAKTIVEWLRQDPGLIPGLRAGS